MCPASVYVLDTNVFIEAARRYYALDIAPGFWDALISVASEGRIISIDKVKGEIDQGNDALKEWADSSFHKWFVSTDQEDVLYAYASVMQWAQSQAQYTPAAQEDFAKSPDGWVIAFGLAKGCIVVTHEVFDANTRKKIKIPNACEALKVQYIDTFRMLRDLGVKLV